MKWSKTCVLEKLTTYQTRSMGQAKKQVEPLLSDKNLDTLLSPSQKTLIPAAVLVPLVIRKDEITVLLTKRTNNLNNHAGQISFPGGRVDDDDRDPRHTALRETEEEIGLNEQHIEVVGNLNDYVVGTGFIVTPIIGFVEPPFQLNPHENEVAEVFEASLYFLTHPNNFEKRTRIIRGIERTYFAIQWNDRIVWGATAGILRDLSQRLWSTDD